MKKKLLSIFVTISLMTCMAITPAFGSAYYTTAHGLELTEAQYENLTKVYTEEDLDCLPIPYIDSIKDDSTLRTVSTDEVYIVTKTHYDENNTPIEIINEEVSKAEAERVAAVEKKAAEAPKTRARGDSDVWQTTSKKLTLNLNLNSSEIKHFSLACKWLVMPKVRSYDVLALRTSHEFLSTFINFSASQNYNNSTINYSASGNNAKSNSFLGTATGFGISMNIVDTASLSSLSCSMGGQLDSKARPFTMYGTYQHATSKVTLSQSKDYSFGAGGLGNVLKFDSSVKGKYDGMQGVSATVDDWPE